VSSVKLFFYKSDFSAVRLFYQSKARMQLYPAIATLVLSCTISEALQVFLLMTPPIFHPNFRGVPAAPGRPRWASPSRNLNPITREIIFQVLQPV